MHFFSRLFVTTFFVLSFFIFNATDVLAEAKAPQSPAQSFSFFLPFIIIIAIIYFLMIRPQQKQAKDRQNMINALQKGENVVTAGGLHGRIVGLTEQVVTLEVADNCKVKIERASIQTIKKD